MNYMISAGTDIGIKRETNQDSIYVRSISSPQGRMVFAALCDGMGGLSSGEVASATLTGAFSEWVSVTLPLLSKTRLEDDIIRREWRSLITCQNEKLMKYGECHGISLGTTVVVLLITAHRYYLLNVGDSRAYEISKTIAQITNDHTLIARELALGHITSEEAIQDPRHNVLLQCIGASRVVRPDMFFGETQKDAVYLLCSDGFRHKITSEEIRSHLEPEELVSEDILQQRVQALINLNKQREEEDNISVITIRTF
jgi:serine/threonine protein phosphatase PrpC